MSQGLQYIHFLKSPPSCVALHQPFKVVLTITNDLTDEKCYEEVTLECKVYDGHWRPFDGLRLKDGSNIISYNPFNGGFCSFEASITELPPCGTGIVRLQAQATSSSSPHDPVLTTTIGADSLYIPVWTTGIRVIKGKKSPASDSENQLQCERRLHLPEDRTVRILEDKQESIARHLWYSSNGVCASFALHPPHTFLSP
jgi:hypothetical protein